MYGTYVIVKKTDIGSSASDIGLLLLLEIINYSIKVLNVLFILLH